MCAVAGPGNLDSCGHAGPGSSFRVRSGVEPPGTAVEVADQQAAGTVRQHHVKPAGGRVFLSQVRGDDLIGKWQILRVVAGGAGPPFRRPAFGAFRSVLPAVGVHIAASREEGPVQAHLGLQARLVIYPGQGRPVDRAE